MNPRICRCCGEPISGEGNTLSRNPNVCASCSSMADGMEESNVPECAELASGRSLAAELAEKLPLGGLDDKPEELVGHGVQNGSKLAA
jgi:hypothetical protein